MSHIKQLVLDVLKPHKPTIIDISEKLSSDYWYNTQAVSYSLLSIGKFTKENKLSEQLKFAYNIDGGSLTDAGSQKAILHVDIPVSNSSVKKVQVINKSDGILYARLIVHGQPIVGDQTEAANHLAIKVVYKTTDGGTNWFPSSDGLQRGVAMAGAFEHTNSNVFYHGSVAGVQKTTDGGVTWLDANHGLPQVAVRGIATDPSTEGTLYIATQGMGIFKSDDAIR